jgi:hypothetical protein
MPAYEQLGPLKGLRNRRDRTPKRDADSELLRLRAEFEARHPMNEAEIQYREEIAVTYARNPGIMHRRIQRHAGRQDADLVERDKALIARMTSIRAVQWLGVTAKVAVACASTSFDQPGRKVRVISQELLDSALCDVLRIDATDQAKAPPKEPLPERLTESPEVARERRSNRLRERAKRPV